MDKIVYIDEYKPHETAEVMCLHCMNRWLSVYEQGEWLAKCGIVSGIIYNTSLFILPGVLTVLFKYDILYT